MQQILKIKSDGSHFYGMMYSRKKYLENENINSKKNYISEFAEENKNKICNNNNKKEKMPIIKELDDLFKRGFEMSINEGFIKKEDCINYIDKYIVKNNRYGINLAKDELEKKYQRLMKNIKKRKDRFKDKVNANKWNYFVTLTYDENKHNDQSFLKKVKTMLSHFHHPCRGDWKYMGVFERSRTGRLHFHGLFYIPHGTMRGNIKEVEDYSTKTHKRQISHVNDYFEKKFGRNDFVQIDSVGQKAINYILKYISKTDDKIFYCRGLKDYIVILLPKDKNKLLFKVDNIYHRYIFSDDILEGEVEIKLLN